MIKRFSLFTIMAVLLINCGRYGFLSYDEWSGKNPPGGHNGGGSSSSSSASSGFTVPAGSIVIDNTNHIVYVGENGNINSAIMDAISNSCNEVRLTALDYNISGTTIDMVDGISIFGGYDSNFTVQDPDTYHTNINYDGTGSAISCLNGMTNTTYINGVTINTSQLEATGILCNGTASPTITNNNIIGATTGININNSTGPNSTIIEGNFIRNSTSGGVLSNSAGIRYIMTGTNGRIINNIVYGGSGFQTTTGIDTKGADSSTKLLIYNNTIISGVAISQENCLAISTSGPDIRNNIFYCSAGTATSRCGIYGNSGSDWASYIHCNCFYNCTTIVRRDGININDLNATSYQTVSEGSQPLQNFGNFIADPGFVDQVYFRLQSSSPSYVKFGGEDLHSVLTTDFYHNPRTYTFPYPPQSTYQYSQGGVYPCAWSIGAHEFD